MVSIQAFNMPFLAQAEVLESGYQNRICFEKFEITTKCEINYCL